MVGADVALQLGDLLFLKANLPLQGLPARSYFRFSCI